MCGFSAPSRAAEVVAPAGPRRPAVLVVALIPVALCLVSSVPARGQSFETVGVRALGMAGAFVAVADDATAVYWNPAGLATGPFFTLLGERQTTEATSPPDDPTQGGYRAGATIIALGTPPLGLTYYQLSSRELLPHQDVGAEAGSGRKEERGPVVQAASLVTNHAGVSMVQSLAQGVAVGATFRFVRGSAGLEDRPDVQDLSDELGQLGRLERRSRSTFDLDAGAMVAIGRLRGGLVVRNLREPVFETPTGVQLGPKRLVRAGVAVMADDRLTIACDVDLSRSVTAVGERRNIAIGAERWWLDRRVAVRGGLRANTIDAARVVAAGGLSMRAWSRVAIAGQVTRGPEGADRGWGLAASVQF